MYLYFDIGVGGVAVINDHIGSKYNKKAIIYLLSLYLSFFIYILVETFDVLLKIK